MDTIIMIPVATAIVSLLVGTVIGYAIRKHSWEQKVQNAQNDADHILADARAQVAAVKAEVNAQKQAAEAVKQSAENTKKEKFLKLKNKFVIISKKLKTN